MAAEAAVTARLFSPGTPVEVVRTSTEANLLEQLSRLAAADKLFNHVLVIGHSNQDGIRLTEDRRTTWAGLGRWLEPFKPRRLALIACEAGLGAPVRALFEEIETLNDIYASPFVARKDQMEIFKILMPYLLSAKAVDSTLIALGQLGNLAATGGWIDHWQREASTSQRRQATRSKAT